MKKLVLIIIFCANVFASTLMSQSIQLSDNSGIVANGKNYYVNDTLTSMTIDGISVKNISSNTVKLKSKKIETSLITGATCYMCFAGGCYGSAAYISLKYDSLIPNAKDSLFSGHYNPHGNYGESIITFVFFNIANVNDSAWIIVHFNAAPLGIKEIASSNAEFSNPYPNPAINSTTFNYSLPKSTSSARIVLRNLLGSKVYESEINNLDGKLTLNTSNINEGIYFYSFYVNDKMVLTKKLIIRH